MKKALIDSNCPLAILNELLEKSDENNWPVGLSDIFHRDENLTKFRMYKCRKLHGENVIAVMNSDNLVLEKNLIDTKLGFIILFIKDAVIGNFVN